MIKKTCVALAAFCMAVYCGGCFKLTLLDSVYNYQNFLDNLVIYNPPVLPDKLPNIKNFEPLINTTFDFAKPFDGDFTYVTQNNKKLLMDKDGKLFESVLDLSDVDFKYDKIIFSQEGKFGVKDLSGNVMIAAQYDDCDILGDLILLPQGTSAYIYLNSVFFSESKFKKKVAIYDEKAVILDGELYDLRFNPCVYNKNKLISTASDGMIMFVDSGGAIGFVSEDYSYEISPQFSEANDFYNGYAMAAIDDRRIVIDKNGTIVFEKDGVTVKNFYDGYFCFIQNKNLGVMNADFEVVIEPLYYGIMHSRVYGKYLIDTFGNPKFFSVEKSEYVGDVYKDIKPIDGMFICRDLLSGSYSLIDENLETLIDGCDGLAYSNGVLLINKDGKYAYYKGIGNEL